MSLALSIGAHRKHPDVGVPVPSMSPIPILPPPARVCKAYTQTSPTATASSICGGCIRTLQAQSARISRLPLDKSQALRLQDRAQGNTKRWKY
jgi:hypothetical protein